VAKRGLDDEERKDLEIKVEAVIDWVNKVADILEK
jgi:hypothetical protein